MKDLIKKEFILEGLDCANCALKIENEVKALNGINSVHLNFCNKKMTVEAASKQELVTAIAEIIKIVKRHEPHVEVIVEDKQTQVYDRQEDTLIKKHEMIRFGIGAALFAAGIIFKFSLWLEFSIYFLSFILIGGEVLLKSAKNIIKGQLFDENFLMSVATIGAFIIGEFPEGVAVMLFYQIGELFQSIAVNRSRKSIKELMNIRPDYANLKTNNDTTKVSPEEVNVGDLIVVKPGEKIPLDGKILEGESLVDTSALTGEAMPRHVEKGDEVLSGFVNKNGLLTIEVLKEFEESTVSKILDLVQNASSKKAATENFITKFARYYTPAVVFVALALALIPPLLIKDAVFTEWIYRALVFLVVSCPCALVVSIPLGFFGGIGGASRGGILIKGSNYLEALNNIDTVVFDKTGTLTKGVFKVTAIKPINGLAENTLLEYAAYAESYSNHPIALSILKAYGKERDKSLIESYEEISGHGIKVRLSGKDVLAGNDKLMSSNQIAYSKPEDLGTVVHIAVDNKYLGYIAASDEIKPDSETAVMELRSMGVRRIIMLTGDIKSTAEAVGNKLGLDKVYYELLPHEKVEKLEALENSKQTKGKLVFAGDGINDAPVLARADIGIAMGGLGSDAAIEAADIVIMTDEPSKIAAAIRIARYTKAIVWQNIILAFSIKLIVLALGAGGIATMWEAVFADVGVALLAILNSMRVLSVYKHNEKHIGKPNDRCMKGHNA